MADLNEHLLSISQVADALGCSDVTIRRAIRARRLPALLLNGRYKVRPRALAEFLDAFEVEGRPSPQ